MPHSVEEITEMQRLKIAYGLGARPSLVLHGRNMYPKLGRYFKIWGLPIIHPQWVDDTCILIRSPAHTPAFYYTRLNAFSFESDTSSGKNDWILDFCRVGDKDFTSDPDLGTHIDPQTWQIPQWTGSGNKMSPPEEGRTWEKKREGSMKGRVDYHTQLHSKLAAEIWGVGRLQRVRIEKWKWRKRTESGKRIKGFVWVLCAPLFSGG